jgi:hypothetical protein
LKRFQNKGKKIHWSELGAGAGAGAGAGLRSWSRLRGKIFGAGAGQKNYWLHNAEFIAVDTGIGPDPVGSGPHSRIRTKIYRIRNTGLKTAM